MCSYGIYATFSFSLNKKLLCKLRQKYTVYFYDIFSGDTDVNVE